MLFLTLHNHLLYISLQRFGQLRNSRVLQLRFARSFAQPASGSLYRPLGALASAPYQPEITCPFAAAALRRDNGLRRLFCRDRQFVHQSVQHSESAVGAPQAQRGAPAISPGIEDPFINRYIIPIPLLPSPLGGGGERALWAIKRAGSRLSAEVSARSAG